MQSISPQDWPPTATLAQLRLRGEILSRIRAYFQSRQVLEVETPLLSVAGATDPAVHSFETRPQQGDDDTGSTLYLHTSPEFPMKRLLAAGSGPIYQICKVFRQGEHGRLHNPEFTMLEWYRPGYDHHDLMDEVEALLRVVLEGLMDFPVAHRCTYRELFQRYVDVDPFRDDVSLLQCRIREQGLELPLGLGDEQTDPWRDFLLTHVIEPRLPKQPVFVYDFPVNQAALARLRPGDPPVAERFELYVNGVELANGYHELTDSEAQRERIERDVKVRQKAGLPYVPTDQRLLCALDAGLPDCAGVAVGIDRLIMMAAGASSIREVMSFPADRA